MISRFLRAALCLCFASLLGHGFGQEGDSPDPYQWVVGTYSFPSHQLATGFTSEERGALKAPVVPAEDASDEQIRDFMRKSNSVANHYLEMQGLSLPRGSLVLFDPESLTLAARAPAIAQSSIAFTAEALRSRAEKYVSLNQWIFAAPPEVLRDVVRRSQEKADHADLLRELEEAARGGGVEILASGSMECRSGNLSKIEQAEDIMAPCELALDADQVDFTTEVISSGTTWEIDAIIGSDDETIDLNLHLNHHYSPAVRKQAPLTARGEKAVTSALVDTFDVNLTSQYAMKSGTARLLGAWKPEGPGLRDRRMQAAFIAADVVKVLPLPNESLSRYLEQEGEAVLPIPEGKPTYENEAEEIPEGMIVRRYTVPPTLLQSGPAGGGGGELSDPFSSSVASEPRFQVSVTARDILRAAGIPFPAGSSANYLAQTSTLVVRNTPENIQLVESYIMSIRSGVERSISVVTHIVQAPAALLQRFARETRSLANHQRQWETLIESDGVTLLQTLHLEARSGIRAKLETGWNYAYHAGASSWSRPGEDKDEKPVASGLSPEMDQSRIGAEFEFDPVLGADYVTIDLNFRLHYDYAPPQIEGKALLAEGIDIAIDAPTPRFREARITNQTTMRSGMIRMVGMWEPRGALGVAGPEVLQGAFIRPVVVALIEGADG